MAGYHEIAAQLRSEIERGAYAPGESIPTEPELAARYGVARGTVRRALLILKSDGLLRTATKRGTYVVPPPVRLAIDRYAAVLDPDRPRADLGPWEAACAAQGVDGQTEMTGVERAAASDDLADRLGVPAGTEVVHRARRMWAGRDVAQIQDAWMPAELVEGTPLVGAEKVGGGVYAAMTAAGLVPASVTEEVTARTATTDERRRLDLREDAAPVLEIWRTTRDPDGRVLEVLRIVADARLSTLVYADLPIR